MQKKECQEPILGNQDERTKNEDNNFQSQLQVGVDAQTTPEPSSSLPETKDNRCLAIFFRNISLIFMLAGTVCYKIVGPEGFAVVDFCLLRNISALIISYSWCRYSGYSVSELFPSQMKYMFLLRCFIGSACVFLHITATPMAPLSLIMILRQTSPFFVTIIAYIMLSEPVLLTEIVAMVICFSAVVVIGVDAQKQDAAESDNEYDKAFLGLVLSFIGAIGLAYSSVINRSLKQTPAPVIVFYVSLVGFFIFLFYLGVEAAILGEGLRFGGYTARQLWIAIAGGIFDVLALLAFTLAFQLDTSAFISLVGFLRIPYAYVLDFFWFDTPLSAVSLISTLVICIVAIGVSVYKVLLKQKEKEKKQLEEEEEEASEQTSDDFKKADKQ